MLIQAIASGANYLIHKCTRYKLPGVWEIPTYVKAAPLGGVAQRGRWVSEISREIRIVTYHAVCDAIDGAALGVATLSAANHMNPQEIEPDESAIVVIRTGFLLITGGVLGGIVGVVRGARISAGTDHYPHYYDLLVGTAAGFCGVLCISDNTDLALLGAGVGLAVGASVMSARLVANFAYKCLFSTRHA